MKGPERIETERLILRRPQSVDATSIFHRYASDPEVTRFLAWPTHRSVADTRLFLEYAEECWCRWPAGPYLIESRETGQLLGSTGLEFETSYRAATGYVLAKEAWGLGYATEALRAIQANSASLGIQRLYALCHHEHTASARVLSKCGFIFEGFHHAHTVFPNEGRDMAQDVVCFAWLPRKPD